MRIKVKAYPANRLENCLFPIYSIFDSVDLNGRWQSLFILTLAFDILSALSFSMLIHFQNEKTEERK